MNPHPKPPLFNPANLLTFFRIAVIPAFVATFYADGHLGHWLGLILFVTAALTDMLDGYVARRWNFLSPMGRFLDPIADKLLVATAIIMLVDSERIAGWDVLAAIVILCREILVSGLREFLAELQVAVPVTRLAKFKTTLQMFALSFLILGVAAPWGLPMEMMGSVCLWAAAALTFYTGYDYMRAGVRHMS